MMKFAGLSTTILLLKIATASVVTHCVSNCTEQNNGDYNSCGGCSEIVTCSEGSLSITSCSQDTYFDSVKGYCDWESSTCTETNTTDNIQPTPSNSQTNTESGDDQKLLQKSILYTRDQYQTTPCVINASAFKTTSVRSKIECGSNCDRTPGCWYFQHIQSQCFMYALDSPPCFVDIYKYNG